MAKRAFVIVAVLVLFRMSLQSQKPALKARESIPPDDPIALLVNRLDLERYKATIKALTQFGDRRHGTDRNRDALNWIEGQLKNYGCEPERHQFTFTPPPKPPAPPAPSNNATTRGEGGSRLRGLRESEERTQI